jgi:DNA-binding PadR family transcriptional regulator
MGWLDGRALPGARALGAQGLLESDWGVSENNRKAKFYRLTAAGRRRLKEETASWEALAAAMSAALKARAEEA